MKTIITSLLSLSLLLALTNTVEAQNNRPNRVFKKGQLDLQAGIGLAPTFLADGGRQLVPPMSLSADMMLSDNFSVGLFSGYTKAQSKEFLVADGIEAQWQNSMVEVGARFAFHYTKMQDWDIYGGFAFTYSHSSITAMRAELDKIAANLGVEPTSSAFFPTAVMGARWAFSSKWTAFSEISYGVSIIKAGVGYRLLK